MDGYNISDEQLASFIDNGLDCCDNGSLGDALSLDDVEVLAVAERALNTFPKAEVVEIPDWMHHGGGRVACCFSAMPDAAMDVQEDSDLSFFRKFATGITSDDDDE